MFFSLSSIFRHNLSARKIGADFFCVKEEKFMEIRFTFLGFCFIIEVKYI